MSEFSMSFHLHGATQQAAVELLERGGIAGAVLPEENGWVCVVAGTFGDARPPTALLAWPDILVHFTHAADHGYGLTVFVAGELISEHSCSWDDGVTAQSDAAELSLLSMLAGLHGADADQQFELARLIVTPTEEDAYERDDESTIGHAVADLLGLTHYEWIGPDYPLDHVLGVIVRN